MDGMLLRAEEVAKLLKLSRAKTYELMSSGVLPTVRIGRSVRVPQRALEDWIQKQTKNATATGATKARTR